MKLLRRMGYLAIGIVLWLTLFSSTALAAGVVGTGSPASCDANDLAEALIGGGIVIFNCGSAPFTMPSDTYVIQDDTTVRGANLITLDGENLRQHFIVQSGVSLTLQEINLLDGESAQGGCIAVDLMGTLITTNVRFERCRNVSDSLGGGAVLNRGTYMATQTVFEGNRAEATGGAVLNRGTFNASFVTFEANSAGSDSGAVHNEIDGKAVIDDAIFIGNSAAVSGGAVGNALSVPSTSGSFTIRRCLFIDNSSTTIGGGINNEGGSMTIENCTFVRNTSGAGGGFYGGSSTISTIRFSTFVNNRADTAGAVNVPLQQTGEVRLGYTILAASRNEANLADSLECDGPPANSLGFNLVEDNSCVDDDIESDIRATSPLLGDLADNGGFSRTMLPASNSPALNKVPSAQCLAVDQRGAQRIGNCDIGAAERGALFQSAFLPRVHR